MDNNFLANLATKLGFNPTPAPNPAPNTPISPKNELVPKPSLVATQKTAISLPDPGPNDLITKINKAMGLENAPLPRKLQPMPKPTPEQQAEANRKTRDLLQAAPRGFVRLGASTGAVIASAFGKVAPPSITMNETPTQRFFFGNEPIDTYQTEYKKMAEQKKEAGVPGYVYKPLLILSVAGEAAGDILGILPEGQARNLLGKETKALTTALTAETDAAKIARTLKESNISADIAEKYAADFAATKTTAETKKVLKNVAAEQIQKTTQDATERLAQLNEKSTTQMLTPDELNEQTFLKANMNNPGKLFVGYQTQEAADAMKAEQGFVPDNMKPEAPETVAKADHTVERGSTGDYSKINFRDSEVGSVSLGRARTVLKDAGYSDSEINQTLSDLMKTNSKGESYVYPSDVKAALLEKATSGEASAVSKISDSEGNVVYDAHAKSEPSFGGVDGPANPESISRYNRFRQELSTRWTKIVENFQNNKNRVEKLVKNPEAIVTEESNPALAHVLYSGRLDTRIRQIQKELEGVVKTTVSHAEKADVPYKSFKNDVNDYLHSLHAPERNAKLGEGAAGITNEEALKMQSDLKSKAHFKQIKETADKLLEMNKKTLDTLYQGGSNYGVIDKKTYDLLRDTYKNHVPLNRIFEDTENISDVLTGRGFDVRGSGLKRAKGSAREVADIYANITSNAASAVQRIEKNIVDNATYEFVKANEDMGFAHVMKRPPTSTTDPTILQLRVAGKDKYIKFEDIAVADQFKGVGNERLPTMLKFVETFTRFYSGLATRFNPEFVLSNKFRDLQEAMVFASAEGKLNKGAMGVLKREAQLQNERAILDHMRGVDSEGARAYQSMLDNGGATGGMALSTRSQVETKLADIEKLARSKPKQALNAVIEKVDQANEIFENSTRLSVYREGLAQGLSEKEAAALAKESTVNFNRKGKWGSVINSLYMFSNASLQGSAKMIKAMRNPKVLAATAASVGSAVFITNKYNDSVDPDWRDKVNKFDRGSNMVVVLQGGDGKKFKYITIPVSYALKPFKVAFDGAYDLASGAKDTNAKDVLGSTVASVVAGYNPVGGTDLGSALTPTIADVPREIGVNRKWTGSKIRPDANADLPDSRQYFDSLKDTPLGRAAIALTKKLSDNHIAEISPANMVYALQQYSGGAGQFASRVFDTVTNSVGGKPTPLSDVPFVSRFYKSVSGDELAARQDMSGKDAATIKKIRSEGAAASFDKSQYIKDSIDTIKNLKTNEEKKKAIDGMLHDHPEMIKDILAQVKKDSKSYSTTQLESLQIKNGERAKFIIQKMDSLKTKKEKADFIDQLATDGLLTDEVIKQISTLKGK